MNELNRLEGEFAEITSLLQARFGVGSTTSLATALIQLRRDLPHRVRRLGARLAAAQPMLDHPHLRMTLDHHRLLADATELHTHLRRINAAQQRQTWWLGVLGGLMFNLALFGALVLAFVYWYGTR